MNNREKAKNIIAPSFVFVMTALWIIIVFISSNRYIAYAGVVACFAFSLLFINRTNLVLVQVLAFAFTVIADFFLILLEGEHKTIAMLSFLIAQGFYALKTLLYAKSKREKRVQLILRLALSIVGGALVFIVLKSQAQALFVISVVYYVNLILSVIFSYMHFKGGKNQKLTAIGLSLFSLCDITIGFDFLIDIFSLGASSLIYKIVSLPINLVHFFYYPSQTLLAVSVLTKNK
jgi:hypothetical protein